MRTDSNKHVVKSSAARAGVRARLTPLRLALVVAAVALVADLGSKIVVVTLLRPEWRPGRHIVLVFHAAGTGRVVGTFVVLLVSLVVLPLVIGWAGRRINRFPLRFASVAVGLLAAGGVGNAVSLAIWHGSVPDFFTFAVGSLHGNVNIADCELTVAFVALLGVFVWSVVAYARQDTPAPNAI